MPKLVKAVSEPMSQELAKSLVGKYVHVTINEHVLENHLTGESKVQNVWFAGRVAGFEYAEIFFDWRTQAFVETPEKYMNLLLTDGSAWVLSNSKLEINEVDEDEFQELVAQYAATEALEKELQNPSILVPDKKIILPNGGTQ